ncbi:hypothetical protein Tco_0651701 [Tanacetum coccineum]|uniref:Retrotransposon gag domain-containing protein n=1 Tax=Tanacetum coccineum TaxID=301880 RepID=A0ABQ4WVN6_9ASTR
MHEKFRGTKGAVGLTRWFEKLESQFRISNVAEGDRVKFASNTLLDGALTWWNVYVRSITLDTAHATPWSDFKAMFIQKYCPRNKVPNAVRLLERYIEGHKAKDCRAPPSRLAIHRDPGKPKEDREVMLLVLDVASGKDITPEKHCFKTSTIMLVNS